jgi:hypothetical protein
MATPGELIEAMAMTLGISIATVAQFDRQLSESGLRSKSGRGSSAAKVTPRDAANLLISILAAPVAGSSIKNAARTCEIYGALPNRSAAFHKLDFSKFGLHKLSALPNEHCLLQALSTAIEGVMSGEVMKLPSVKRKGRRDSSSWVIYSQFGIGFGGPRPWAEIRAHDTFVSERSAARLIYTSDAKKRIESDLYQERRITFATIRTLGLLLSGRTE